jgi:hypothetical protein
VAATLHDLSGIRIDLAKSLSAPSSLSRGLSRHNAHAYNKSCLFIDNSLAESSKKGEETMTEQEIKETCKYVIEHGKREFTENEKEILKAAVPQSRNLQELFAVAIASLGMGRN